MSTVSFSAKAYLFTAVAASVGGARTYLCGVKVEVEPTGRVILAATDGHMLNVSLGACPDNPQSTSEFTIATNKDIEKAARARLAETIEIEHTDSVGQFIWRTKTKNGGVIAQGFGQKLCETFPQWRRVVPQGGEPSLQGTAISSALLSRLAKSGEILCGSATPIRIAGVEEVGPQFVTYGDYDKAFTIVMPMRMGGPVSTCAPGWLEANPNLVDA